jgi:hypothetical protein
LSVPRKAGRPLWWVAGLSLCLLLGTGILAWSLTSDDTYVAPTPSETRQRVSPALASQTLQHFVDAVDARDAAAARALAPAGDTSTADRLAALVHNADRLRIAGFTVRYVDDEGALSADGSWAAAVDATWRMAGFDRTAARAELLVHLRQEDDRVALTGFGGGDRVSPLWLTGPVQVRRSPATLVLVDGSAAQADRYAVRARAAVPVVRRVLPQWRGGLVVEVPASVGDLDRVLDADPGSYDQIAATTTSADGSNAPDTPVHVFVNPDVFGLLGPTEGQVVMSHEATHVATDAWEASMPPWLLEGFADYVALRDTDLPVTTAAGQAIADVGKDGPPRALPGELEFGTRATHLGATYESAWLAVRLLAQDGGEAALVRFYRSVDDGAPVGGALRATFGLSLHDFTRQWRSLLADLALSHSTR